MSTHRRAVTGALLLLLAAVVFWSAEATTASGWTHPGYSYRWDVISDLGNPVPHDFVFKHVVNSPWYFVMNFGFALSGILFGSAVVILHRLFSGPARIAILATGMLESVGLLVLSTFNQQSLDDVEMNVHWFGAFLTLTGSVTIVLVSVFGNRVGAPRWYRVLSIVFGACIFVSFIALFNVPGAASTVGAGAMERISMWGALIWQVITAGALLAGRHRLAAKP